MRAHGLEADVASAPAHAQAWAALLEAAHQVEADVLVCGTRGRGGFARALLGSTSSSLLHHTDLPLLVVPDGGGRLDGPVIAVYDGSGTADRAITTLGRLLGSRPAIVVHAWDSAFHHSLPARAPEGFGGDRREIIQLSSARSRRTRRRPPSRVLQRRAPWDWRRWVRRSVPVPGRGALWQRSRHHEAAVIAVGPRGLGAARSALSERRAAGFGGTRRLSLSGPAPERSGQPPAHWAPKRIRVPKSARKERNLRTSSRCHLIE
jgi:hypothetical protein